MSTPDLGRMPEMILDRSRDMLWQLEDDGMCGAIATGKYPHQYVRRSLGELRAVPGELVPLMGDHRPRGADALLVDPPESEGEN